MIHLPSKPDLNTPTQVPTICHRIVRGMCAELQHRLQSVVLLCRAAMRLLLLSSGDIAVKPDSEGCPASRWLLRVLLQGLLGAPGTRLGRSDP
jgi:hypothetical protein